MTTEAPPRIPGPPKAAPSKPDAKNAEEKPPRRMSRHAVIGAAPLAIGGVETVGVNYGTTGFIITTAVAAVAGVGYKLRRVWLPLLGLRAATRRTRVTGPGRGGVLSRLRSPGAGRPRGAGGVMRRLTGGRGGSGAGRRGPLARLGGKARGLAGRASGSGRKGGLLGRGPSRGAKRGGSPLRRAAGALGKAGRTARGTAARAGRALTGRSNRPGNSKTPLGGSGRGRSSKRSSGTGSRGLLGRLSPKGRSGSRAIRRTGVSAKGGAGRRGLFGRRNASGGPKGRSASRGRGLLSGVAGKRANRVTRNRSGTPGRTRNAGRPQTKAQRKRVLSIPNQRDAWRERWQQNQADRRDANGVLTFAEHHNRGLKRAPQPAPTDQPRTASQPQPASTGRTGRMPNPFESVEDAMNSAPAIEVENARAVMDFNEHAPEFAHNTAEYWRKHGEAIKEGLQIAPEYSDALDNLTAAHLLLAEDVAETGQVWTRSHEEKIKAIEEPLPNADKWDISKNRD